MALFEREFIGARTSEGRARTRWHVAKAWAQAETHRASAERSHQAARSRRGDACGDWPHIQCEGLDEFEASTPARHRQWL